MSQFFSPRFYLFDIKKIGQFEKSMEPYVLILTKLNLNLSNLLFRI
jgi:hypothetical protein